MLGVCLTQFPFRANMVVKIHVWRLEEGVFHSIDSDDIPGGSEECVVQNKAVLQHGQLLLNCKKYFRLLHAAFTTLHA